MATKKSTKHRKLDILANWSLNLGERVEEDDGVIVVTCDKNSNVLEEYDTEVKLKAELKKCRESLFKSKMNSKKEKVNNTTVSFFLLDGPTSEALH